ncbi:metallophosphoesterase [Erwinia sp. 9145]|uniref:metallophosphoesterase n=1 Tax=Erwinia sp. 9145 TaxID=1500895 RepID=UPI000ADA8BCE|nr:metallophosphoesterase [Erwinia sp. 9145]
MEIAARLKEQISTSLLLPGNSDNHSLMRQTWDKAPWACDSPGMYLHFSYDAGDIRLTGLDSTVSEESYGSVSGRLKGLRKQLSEGGNTPMLLFLHHHVFLSGIPTLDETMCKGLDELEELIRSSPHRILAVSSGHVHRPVAGTFASIPANICGPVCHANPLCFGSTYAPPAREAPMLMIQRYDQGKLSSHHVCVS